MNKTEVTKKRVFIVSFLVILATTVAYTAVYVALSALVAAKGFDAWTVGLWSSLGGAIAFYGVSIGLIWWAYPRTRARVEHPSRFYVRRHWRGESGLGISWWANGIPVGVLVAVASAGLDGLDMAAHPTAIALGYVGMIVLGLVLIIWHWVGVWRSAGHARSAFWGVTARVLTVMAFGVQVANAANHSIPSATEMVNIAFGTDAIPRHRLRILNGGKEIELAGGIDFGTVTDFKVLLDATPAVETIDLNNIGGRVAEAEKLRDIVQARHLSTYTSTMCASACTVVFMGGQQRYLGANGKLGFHRWSFPGQTADQDASMNAAGERAMIAAGVTPAFATKAFSTPANDLWVPDTATLLAAHVVTRMTDGNNFAATAGDPTTYTVDQIDRMLAAANPVLAAMKRWEPSRYAQITRDYVAGLQQGKTPNDLLAAADRPLTQVVESYMLIADDDVQLQIAQTYANHARLLQDHPAECVGMFDGTSSTYDALLPKEATDQNKNLSAGIIESGATHPSLTRMPQQAFDEEKRLIWQSVFSAYPNARSGFSSPPDQSARCTGLGAFYEAVTRLPPSQAGAFLRRLWVQS
jgi:hypothetical protein